MPTEPSTSTKTPQTFTTPSGMIVNTAGQTLPDTSKAADVSSLNAPKVNIPSPIQPAPVTPPSIDSIINSAYQPTKAQTQYDQGAQNLGNLEGQLASKSTDQAALNQQYDLPGKTQTVNDLTNQFNSLNSQRQASPLQIEQAYQHRGATTGGVAPIQSAADRDLAIQQIGVSAALNAANGNLATAQQQVQYALDAKYAPIQAQIDTQKAQLDALSPLLSHDEKKQAAELQAQLQDRQNQVDQAKQDQSQIYDTLTTAAKNGADSLTLSRIMQAKTPNEAIAAAGTFIGTPNIITSTDNAGNIYGIDQNTGKVLWTANGVGKAATAATAATYSPDLIDAVQSGLIDPSKVNSRTAPFYNALAQAGVDAVGSTASAQTYITVSKTLGTQLSAINQAKAALDQNVSYLASLSDKVNTVGVPKYDNISNSLLSQYSNQPDIVKYLNVLNTVRSEYAKYLARGSQVTDAIRSESNDAIPAGIDGNSLQQLQQALDTEGSNVQASYQYAQDAANQARHGGTISADAVTADSTVPAFKTDSNGRISSGSTSSGLGFTITY